MKAMYYSYPNVAANTIVLGYSVRIGKENEDEGKLSELKKLI